MMRIQCQKRDENNGMAEQSEKVADIDPRFSSSVYMQTKTK